MSAHTDKIRRSAARMFAFLQMAKISDRVPTEQEVRSETWKFQQNYIKAEKKMKQAYEGSSDKGRNELRKKWQALLAKGNSELRQAMTVTDADILFESPGTIEVGGGGIAEGLARWKEQQRRIEAAEQQQQIEQASLPKKLG